MNFQSNWWLLIGTVLSQVWLFSALPKKKTSLKQRWRQESRPADGERVKKVGNFTLGKTHKNLIKFPPIHRERKKKSLDVSTGTILKRFFNFIIWCRVSYHISGGMVKLKTGTSHQPHFRGVVTNKGGSILERCNSASCFTLIEAQYRPTVLSNADVVLG